ncbi:uncharacterized protein E0L32_005150 [Thyridium curvatum]|uniref:non-specific serine/threonine protein kinase n=1 Tax=Thyridium curvatum TaxID=1093900 RepID=A0A507AVD3_9PEZI|nr:uncharacterized protein E0L32_005150 [Thyridium curvatum]TPX14755.1 hypothetical protein E0L32_005150 [Thyridium curvatum]
MDSPAANTATAIRKESSSDGETGTPCVPAIATPSDSLRKTTGGTASSASSEFVRSPDSNKEAAEQEPESERLYIKPELEVEDVEKYCLGGFHPIDLGDTLDGRWLVRNKLGQGGFSTVWLCKDLKNNVWRAVKVVTAYASGRFGCRIDFHPEVWIPSTLDEAMWTERERDTWDKHILRVLETFWIEGPNGRHLCFVYPVLGPSMYDIWPLYTNEKELLKDYLFQICITVLLLHTYDIVHGDIKSKNVILKATGIETLSGEEIVEEFGLPVTEELRSATKEPTDCHAPRRVVLPTSLDFRSKYVEKEIVLSDYGCARFIYEPQERSHGFSGYFASPQMTLDRWCAGDKSDTWAVGCTIMDMLIEPPFNWFNVLQYTNEIEDYMGPMPTYYRDLWLEQYGQENYYLGDLEKVEDGTEWREVQWKLTPQQLDELRDAVAEWHQRGLETSFDMLKRERDRIGNNRSDPVSMSHEEWDKIREKRREETGFSDIITCALTQAVFLVPEGEVGKIEEIPWDCTLGGSVEQTDQLAQQEDSDSHSDSDSEYKYTGLTRSEIREIADLMRIIFTWEQEATLVDVMKHSWFGTRYKDWHGYWKERMDAAWRLRQMEMEEDRRLAADESASVRGLLESESDASSWECVSELSSSDRDALLAQSSVSAGSAVTKRSKPGLLWRAGAALFRFVALVKC